MHPHDARNGYGCLTASDSGLPPVSDDVGHRQACTCGRTWEIREMAGFVVWQPIELDETEVRAAIVELLDELHRWFREPSPTPKGTPR